MRSKTQNLGGCARRGAGSRRLGMGIKPSRCACFLAALRARRMASAFSRVLRSDTTSSSPADKGIAEFSSRGENPFVRRAEGQASAADRIETSAWFWDVD